LYRKIGANGKVSSLKVKGFPFWSIPIFQGIADILVRYEAVEFKFGLQLRFDIAHHKITP